MGPSIEHINNILIRYIKLLQSHPTRAIKRMDYLCQYKNKTFILECYSDSFDILISRRNGIHIDYQFICTEKQIVLLINWLIKKNLYSIVTLEKQLWENT